MLINVPPFSTFFKRKSICWFKSRPKNACVSINSIEHLVPFVGWLKNWLIMDKTFTIPLGHRFLKIIALWPFQLIRITFAGLEINTPKLAKCEWFLEVASKKKVSSSKYLRENISVLESGGKRKCSWRILWWNWRKYAHVENHLREGRNGFDAWAMTSGFT